MEEKLTEEERLEILVLPEEQKWKRIAEYYGMTEEKFLQPLLKSRGTKEIFGMTPEEFNQKLEKLIQKYPYSTQFSPEQTAEVFGESSIIMINISKARKPMNW